MRGLKEALEALEALEQKRELAFVGATTDALALAAFPSGIARFEWGQCKITSVSVLLYQ